MTSVADQQYNAAQLRQARNQIIGALRRTENAGMPAVLAIGNEMRSELIRLVSQGYPPASAPGEPPHSRSGARGLRGSFSVLPGKDAQGFYVDVVSGVIYALYLELGTSKMAPRPFFRVAAQTVAAKVGQIVTKLVRQAIA